MGFWPGLHRGYRQIGVSAFTMHNQVVPPVPFAPNIPGLIEAPGFMDNPSGLPSRKAATTVFFDGGHAVQEGHTMGFFIPHFALPMNLLCAVHFPLSKHKVLFPSSSVQIQGQSMGTYGLLFLPGLICANPVSLPTAVVMLTKCTVWTSIGLLDFLAGVFTCVVDIIFDLLWNKLTNGSWRGVNPTPSGLFRYFPSSLNRLSQRLFRAHPQVLAGLGDEGLGRIVRIFTEGGVRPVAGIVARTYAKEMTEATASKAVKDYVFEPLGRGVPTLFGGEAL